MSGSRSTMATHSASRGANGTPMSSSVAKTSTPAITEVTKLPNT